MPNTSVLALPYPALSSAPNIPQDIQNLAGALDSKLGGIIICTSSTRPASPVDGLIIYETDTKLQRRYDSVQAGWLIWPPQVIQIDEFTTYSTSSTTFSAGSTLCEGTFTCGPTGRLRVDVCSFMGNSATGTNYMGWEIRQTNAAGAVVVAANTNWSHINQGSTFNNATRPRNVSGLTPGQVYYIRTMHQVGSGSATVYTRTLLVTQSPS